MFLQLLMTGRGDLYTRFVESILPRCLGNIASQIFSIVVAINSRELVFESCALFGQ